ncbi:killer cell lectin-like receptor 5 isoform X8 [Apodemus sylvaticus]|uniref:killer cell lectin-like receptor 5 isoform X8 n=1 Tax=Apodemus sylvaticus TaxID=10129 RepID=UPI0022437C70|nr:killer cell lectin-like receptor 5 isoform X8 [Apodemus sylvaticus]XP_052031016.1 killer cell lectin-like receptor 5 isoform X8 [Apodemus sylvaticus]XP_052031017.1 killer cell lectin-like receptor 5 isoform X8 [Apodemus sylvaticus]
MTYIHQNLFRIETNHSRTYFNREHTLHTPNMSDQDVTYSTVRFHKSSGLQNQERPEENQGPREASPKECSVSWHLIANSLGILCAFLLITVAVLLTNIFQHSQEKHGLQETLTNLHQNCSTMKNNIDLKEELLRNKTIECSAGNSLLESLDREQKRWYSETKTVLDSPQLTGRGSVIHWFCYGMKCYYFIIDGKTWSGCKQMCVNYSLSLLTINDEDELKFLQLLVIPNSYWIGLSYDNKIKNWTWIDNGPSKLKINFKPEGCVFLSKARLENSNCRNSYPCVCGKRMDKFPV